MKKIISVIFLFLILIGSTSYAQDLLWKSNFAGNGNNFATKSAIDSKNNVYIVGYFANNCTSPSPILSTRGGDDIYLAKYDSLGILQWARSLGSASNDLCTGIAISPDDEYIYITGIFLQTCFADNGWQITSTGSSDAFLAKYNKDGEITWLKNIGSASVSTAQRPQVLKIDKNKNLVIAGVFLTQIKIGNTIKDTTLYSTQAVGLFFAQLDTAGTLIKAKRFEATHNSSRIYTLDVDTSGYYLAGHFRGNFIHDFGTTSSNGAFLDMFVYKVDFALNSKWMIRMSGAADDQIYSCSVDDKGFFYIGGHFASSTMSVDSTASGTPSLRTATNKNTNSTFDIFFAKYRHDGQLQWFNTAGSTGNDYLYRALFKNGNFIAAGQYNGTMTFNNKTITPRTAPDAFAIVQNQNDNLVYLMNIGGSGNEIGETAVVDNVGNFIVIGDYTSPRLYFDTQDSIDNSEAGTRDVFIAKYDKGSLLKTITPISCYGSLTGTISLTPEGTVVPPYTYNWSKVGDPAFTRNTKDVSGLSAGTYKVTFTDALGYTKSDSITLTNPSPLQITLDSTKNVLCYNGNDGKLFISPSGGAGNYTYTWSAISGSGIMATQQDQFTLTHGNFKVVVKDQNLCADSIENIIVTQPEKLIFGVSTVTHINPPSVLGAIDLTVYGGSPPISYLWSGPASFSSTSEDLSDLTNAGNYAVSVTDINGCANDTSFVVTDPNQLTAGIDTKQDVRCRGELNGSVTISVQNALGTPTFAWSNGGNTQTLTNLPAGNYTVTVTDTRPSSVIVNVSINQPSADLTVSIARTNITCNGLNDGLLDANPNGGSLPYSYTWTKETMPFGGNVEILTSLSEGSYAVTVTDANGCTANNTQSIINPNPISFTGTPTPVTCEGGKNDGAITISNIQGGTGAYSFLWSNGLTSQNISLLPASNYTLTVTDANNCSKSNSYIVGYSSPITVTITPTHITCFGANNGILDANVTGGHGDLKYVWNTSDTTSIINGLSPNIYTVTVTDSKSCTKTQTASISQPAQLVINNYNQTNVSCNGRSDGSITINVLGGTPSYSYQWDQGAGASATVSGLPAATYNVTVTDAKLCTVNGTYTISEPAIMQLTENTSQHFNPLCNGQETGTIAIVATGGYGPYQYSIDGGAWVDTSLFTNLRVGSYNFAVRSRNYITCNYSMSSPIIITEPSAISIGSISGTNITCFGLTNGKITAAGAGGSGTLTYTLLSAGNPTGNTSGELTGEFTNLPLGDDYSILITDTNSCSFVSGILAITQPEALRIVSDTAIKATQKIPEWNGRIEVVAGGGTAPYTYTMNSESNETGIFSKLEPAKYQVIINDFNNCGPIQTDSLLVEDAISVPILNQGKLTFFPNPATDFIMVKFDSYIQNEFTLEFVALNGVPVFNEKISKEIIKQGQHRIELRNVSRGIYLIRINGRTAKEKIVVQ